MKYILVIDHIGTGGAERILLDYYHYLVNKGNEVRIFCLVGFAGQSKWTEGIDVVYGAPADCDNLFRKSLQQRQTKALLQKLTDSFHPDVLFSFLEKSNILESKVRTSAHKVMTVHNVLSIQYTKVHNPLVRRMVYRMIRKCYNHCPKVVAVSAGSRFCFWGKSGECDGRKQLCQPGRHCHQDQGNDRQLQL